MDRIESDGHLTTDCMGRRTSSQNGDQKYCDLIDWLLIEVLIRLPIKSIFKFRCVSSRWKSLISSPFFIQCYFFLRSNPSSSCSLLAWTLLLRDGEDFPDKDPILPHHVKLISMCSHHDIVYSLTPTFSLLDLPPCVRQKHQGQPDKYTVLASSNGLLLCSVSLPFIYYVCNPLTKQWIAIPCDYRVHKPVVGEGFITQVDEGGMVTSYKVVQLGYSNYNSVCDRMLIYASETGKWRSLMVRFPRIIEIRSQRRPISLNGILHWLALSSEIVAYDPYKNTHQCRLIKLPRRRLIQDRDPSLGYDTDLCEVSQGHLQYFEIDADIALVKMWVLQDYDTGIWQLEHMIRVYDMLTDTRDLVFTATFDFTYPLAFHPFDSSIVYLCCRRRDTTIFSYNIRSKTLELLYSGFIPMKMVLSSHSVIPFVLPPRLPQVPQPSRNVLGLSICLQ